jgi:type IV secretion system protein TrbL
MIATTTDIFRFCVQLLLNVLKPAYRLPANFNIGGGIGGTIKSMLSSWFDQTIGKLVDWVGSGVDIRNYTILDDPGTLDAAQNAWSHSLEIAFLLFPIFIILGMLSMPFAERQKTRLWRQGLRIVGVIGIIAVSKPVIGFGIEMSNILTMAFMPSTSEIMKVLAPGAPIAAVAAAALTSVGMVIIGGLVAGFSIIAMGVIVIFLQFRQFFINVVYIASPILAVFWYIDWGLLEDVNEFAAKWGRMGLFTILSGPIIGIIFRASVVTFEQGLATADSGLASLISSLVLLAIVPLLLIAATWKMVSWAGEPVGASQAMTGAIMGAAAMTGAGMEKVMGEAGEGLGSAAQSAGSHATGGSGGSGGGSSGSGSAPSGAGGGGSGRGQAGGGQGTSSESDLAQDLSEGNEQATVEASSAPEADSKIGVESSSASSSGSSTAAGSHTGDSGATGTPEGGPPDSVTGAGSTGESSEPQSYIDAGREKFSSGKERMQNALGNAYSNYSDKAKDSLNPTNALRGRAQQKRAEAGGVQEKLDGFNDAVDTQNGTVDLEEAHESGALGAKPKAVEEGGNTQVELGKDGAIEFEDVDGNDVSQNVGATRQRLRKEKDDRLEEASKYESKADKIDSKLSEHGERLNKTREQLGKGAYDVLKEGGKEALRGTIGSHSPYLQTNRPGGSRGNTPREGSGGGGDSSGSGKTESQSNSGQQSSSGRPRANATAQQVNEHSETLTESDDRFDLRDRYGHNGVFKTDTGPTREGVSQAGYIEDPDSGETITQIEVGEDSDITLSEGEEVELGNVTAVQRDGSNKRSHTEKSGEYESVFVDEQSRTFDKKETRADEIIGEPEAVGETVQTKSGTIRQDPNNADSDEHLFRQEFSDGSVAPIRAPNEESAQALQQFEGQEVDLVADVEQKYGMEPDTHDGYEGPHEYNELVFDVTDSNDNGGSDGDNAPANDRSESSQKNLDSGSSSGKQVNRDVGKSDSAEPINSGEGDEVEAEDSEEEPEEKTEAAGGKEGNENYPTGWGMTTGSGMPDVYTAEKYEKMEDPASRFESVDDEEESESDDEDIDHYVQLADGLDSSASGEIGSSNASEAPDSQISTNSSGSNSSLEHNVTPADGSETSSSESTQSGGSERVDASKLANEFVHRDGESGRVTVDIPSNAKYRYVPEPGDLASEMKSKGYFELENGDEIEEPAPELIGSVAFRGEDNYPADGDWGFEEEDPKIIKGGELNDVNTKVWEVGRPHEHNRGSEMASQHAGGPSEYIQIRPTEETDLSQNQISTGESSRNASTNSGNSTTQGATEGDKTLSENETSSASPPDKESSTSSSEGVVPDQSPEAHQAAPSGLQPEPEPKADTTQDDTESTEDRREDNGDDIIPQEPEGPTQPPEGIEAHSNLISNSDDDDDDQELEGPTQPSKDIKAHTDLIGGNEEIDSESSEADESPGANDSSSGSSDIDEPLADSAESDSERVKPTDVSAGIDVGDTEEISELVDGTHILSEDERDSLREQLEEEYGEEAVDNLYSTIESRVGTAETYDDKIALEQQMANAALDDEMPTRVETTEDVDEDTAEAFREFIGVSNQFVDENIADQDERTVYRGMHHRGGKLAASVVDNPDADKIEMPDKEQAVAFTPEDDAGATLTKVSDAPVVAGKDPTEYDVAATDHLLNEGDGPKSIHDSQSEGEMHLMGIDEIRADEMRVAKDLDSTPSKIVKNTTESPETASEDEHIAMSSLVNGMAEDDVSPDSEAGKERLETWAEYIASNEIESFDDEDALSDVESVTDNRL